MTTISESPFKFGWLYVGSDDGLVHVSTNGGGNWTRISDSFPKDLWVSEVAASKHKKERVYVTLNGYRWDDFTPYVYVSDDMGKSSKNITNNIPASPVNALVEDPSNENLLFVGTDNGLYASMDRGASWELMQNGMPNVAVHDLVIQPTAKHLVVGTHGRSIYRADIANLQELTAGVMGKALHLFALENIKHSARWGTSWSSWGNPNTPGVDLSFFAARGGTYTASVQTANGVEVSAVSLDAHRGMNVLSYDVAFTKEGKKNFLKKNKMRLTEAKNGKTYLPKGAYSITISGHGVSEKTSFEIE